MQLSAATEPLYTGMGVGRGAGWSRPPGIMNLMFSY